MGEYKKGGSKKPFILYLGLGGRVKKALILKDYSGYFNSISNGLVVGSVWKGDEPHDILVAKIGPEGNVEWVRVYGGDYYDSAKRAVKVPGGYIVVGTTTSFESPDLSPWKVWVLGIDGSGNLLWQEEILPRNNQRDWRVVDAEPFKDGAVIVATSIGNYVIRIDPRGRLMWAKDINFIPSDVVTDDEAIYMAGGSSVKGTIMALDGSGNPIWTNVYWYTNLGSAHLAGIGNWKDELLVTGTVQGEGLTSGKSDVLVTVIPKNGSANATCPLLRPKKISISPKDGNLFTKATDGGERNLDLGFVEFNVSAVERDVKERTLYPPGIIEIRTNPEEFHLGIDGTMKVTTLTSPHVEYVVPGNHTLYLEPVGSGVREMLSYERNVSLKPGEEIILSVDFVKGKVNFTAVQPTPTQTSTPSTTQSTTASKSGTSATAQSKAPKTGSNAASSTKGGSICGPTLMLLLVLLPFLRRK
ncbi:hypothetical protein [Thermococcus sp.]